MKVLVAPDSFKGSYSAQEITKLICDVVFDVLPEAEITELPFSDGGEGALDLLPHLKPGEMVYCKTFDPLGREIKAPYYIFDHGASAWIELSQSSGITLLNKTEYNPMAASTYGTGILLKDAITRGCQNLYLGIGGSATHDMGMGIFMALGGGLLGHSGQRIALGGGALGQCKTIDTIELLPALHQCNLTLACDVTNTLLGKQGAAYTYAAQKGAGPKDLVRLESNTAHLADLITKKTGVIIAALPGGGAAGGTAAGLAGLLHAKLESGFFILSRIANLEEKIKAADLVITGEGHFDDQSAFGKVPFQIAALGKRLQTATLIIAGKVSNLQPHFSSKTVAVHALKPDSMPLETAIKKTPQLLKKTLGPVLKYFKKNQTLL